MFTTTTLASGDTKITGGFNGTYAYRVKGSAQWAIYNSDNSYYCCFEPESDPALSKLEKEIKRQYLSLLHAGY